MKIYEAEMKLDLLDFLLKEKSENFILASEVAINQSENLVDILKISNLECHAYEIKSYKDNYIRLPNQIKSYTSVFDYTSVVVPKANYPKVLKELPQKIGVITIDDDHCVKIKRKAKKIIRLNKMGLAKLLWKTELVNILQSKLNISKKNLNIMSDVYLREILTKNFTLKQLKEISYKYLLNRYKNKYLNFINNKGLYLVKEDLLELNLHNHSL